MIDFGALFDITNVYGENFDNSEYPHFSIMHSCYINYICRHYSPLACDKSL